MKLLRIMLLGLLAMPLVTIEAQQLPMERDFEALTVRYDKRTKDDKNLPVDLRNYLKMYPYSTYKDEVQLMYAIIQVENCKKDDFSRPLKELQKVEKPQLLSRPHYLDYQYYMGYCYIMTEQYTNAQQCFRTLLGSKDKENPYIVPATYYSAYCDYRRGDYDKAMPLFKKIEREAVYRQSAPYYIVQMYYARHNYDEVLTRANALLKADPDNSNNAELHRMLGEIYYQRGEYDEAAHHLQRYESWINTINSGDEFGHNKPQKPLELERNDMYLLGMTYYKTDKPAKAIEYLKKVKQQKDTISESTFMTLGNIYVKQNNIPAAMLNYEAARKLAITPALTEEAAYNYALTMYQSNSALGDIVAAFDNFLQEYPDSKYAQRIYGLQCDAYMQANNREEALNVLDRNPQQTTEIRQTKQYLRYQIGVDAFLQGNIKGSSKWMTEVIDHEKESSRYVTEALYWRAEASYRLREFDACTSDLALFRNRPDYAGSANRLPSLYLGAYARFAQKKYEEAKEQFTSYVSSVDKQDRTYTDALNRIGDCCFNARQYEQAKTYYARVIDQNKQTGNATGADYATFQRGYANGLLHQYESKLEDMNTVVSKYPKSDYVVQALYEKARTLIELHREDEAIKTYETLLKQYGRNPKFGAKSALERAMLYRNLGKQEEAIKAYKYTISNYPSTDEAYTALSGLEALYVETNRVSEYVRYTKSLKQMKVVTKDDSLTYAAAELLYMQARYREAAAAMTTYRQQYGVGSRYYTIATYSAADCLYHLEDYEQALPLYQELTQMTGNAYIEEACLRAAEISYDRKEYAAAKRSFEQLQTLATTKDNKAVAKLGVLRCCYFLHDYPGTVTIATQILEEQPDASLRQEAQYNRAKAYLEQKKWTEAQADLKELSREVRTAIGAEAKYQLAQTYFNTGNKDEAEREVMSFTEMNTTQQYWLARAIILLSDISYDAGDMFQTQQYLLSLQANYTAQDDIQTIIAERLARLNQPVVEPDEDEDTL
ncbi:MAG: tetratricopeptide repeat protein [Paludibacteraceae bacterium]|nr:tetratricopeptide repeat protein [Paludibacteraceae bacterium]